MLKTGCRDDYQSSDDSRMRSHLPVRSALLRQAAEIPTGDPRPFMGCVRGSNLPSRHPHGKRGDAFAVKRTITNRPYSRSPRFAD